MRSRLSLGSKEEKKILILLIGKSLSGLKTPKWYIKTRFKRRKLRKDARGKQRNPKKATLLTQSPCKQLTFSPRLPISTLSKQWKIFLPMTASSTYSISSLTKLGNKVIKFKKIAAETSLMNKRRPQNPLKTSQIKNSKKCSRKKSLSFALFLKRSTRKLKKSQFLRKKWNSSSKLLLPTRE
jgi:hypothetical protein